MADSFAFELIGSLAGIFFIWIVFQLQKKNSPSKAFCLVETETGFPQCFSWYHHDYFTLMLSDSFQRTYSEAMCFLTK